MTTSSLINKQCHCDNQVIHKVIQTNQGQFYFVFFCQNRKYEGSFLLFVVVSVTHLYYLLTKP